MNNQLNIRSKKKLIAAFVYLIGIPAFFGVAIGTILPLKSNGWIYPTKPFFIIMSAVVWTFSFYCIYYYFKKFPSFKITSSSITINSIGGSRTIDFTDIIKINLRQKLPLRMLWFAWPVEATSILLKDGDEIVIWDDNYRNIPEIKRTLNALKSWLKKPDTSISDLSMQPFEVVSKEEFLDENFRTFKGSLWTNFEFLSFIVLGGGLSYAALYIPNAPPTILFGLVIVWFLFTAYQQHYFKISADYIQIKNHLIWWVTKTYRTKDIREISFEVPYRGASGIKIMTKDFSTKTCLAATLKTKDFEELKKTFTKLNIKYRGEFE